MDRVDVLIVGGGPAGSSCAWALRKAGIESLILDAQDFPRNKLCAGWITPAVVSRLEIDEIILDQTAFYPLGGGQPSDKGTLRGANGIVTVNDVRNENGVVKHSGSLEGSIGGGEAVTGNIDWNRRYALMRNHTLAHLMAEAVRRATGLSGEVVSSGLDVDKAHLDIATDTSLVSDMILESIQIERSVPPDGWYSGATNSIFKVTPPLVSDYSWQL
jgi:hypothetical protein